MSNLIDTPPSPTETSKSSPDPVFETLTPKIVELGALQVRRMIPVHQRRMIGPWCFLDRFGPLSFAAGKPMDVAPHPHIGLQTVSWLLDGEIQHHDSCGGEALLRPGELNLMTAGSGIAHTEETPQAHSSRLEGIQLWVALHEADRRTPPTFAHHSDLPLIEFPGGRAVIIMGSWNGAVSSAKCFSPLLAVDFVMQRNSRAALPLDPAFEHGCVLLRGDLAVENQTVAAEQLTYLGMKRGEWTLSSHEGARFLLIGGPPFGEAILMWWNFVARNAEEMAEARKDWAAHRRFGEVASYRGPRLEAPPLQFNMKPRSS